MVYVCSKCNKNFKQRELMEEHKLECKGIIINHQLTCPSCSKTFGSSSNLKYHIKKKHYTVALDIQKTDEKDPRVKNITNNNNININNTTNNNTTNNNTTNNNITNITNINNNITNITHNNDIKIQPLLFVKHGDERIDHITKEFLLKLLNYTSAQRMFVELMANLYFSSEAPENNNWSLAYPYNGKAAIVFDYETNKFIRTSTEDIINQKFSNMIDKLVPMIDEINKDRENLTRMQQINILHFYDKECVYELSKKYPDIYALIQKLAYEQRYVPMKTWKEQGFSGRHLSIKFEPST